MEHFDIRRGFEPRQNQWYKVKFHGGHRDGQVAPMPSPVLFFDGYILKLSEDAAYSYVWFGGTDEPA